MEKLFQLPVAHTLHTDFGEMKQLVSTVCVFVRRSYATVKFENGTKKEKPRRRKDS
jgi:hypothetical protein